MPSSSFLSSPLLLFCLILPGAKLSWRAAIEKQRYLSHFISLQKISKRNPATLCVWGEKPLFRADVCLLLLGRAVAIHVLRFCRETQSLQHPKAVSIYNQMVTAQRFVSLRADADCCALLCWGWACHTIPPVPAHLLPLFFHLSTSATPTPSGLTQGSLSYLHSNSLGVAWFGASAVEEKPVWQLRESS